jgi:acylphosphatase
MDTCLRYLFSGNVQGVGFRYTAQGIARKYPVTGYVRNLPDGRVELVAQGSKQEVEAFITDLSGRMGGQIREMSVADAEPVDAQGFEIRF